jgi:AcrR family transcriptional regulator
MSIRQEQIALTRKRILDAVIELSGDLDADDVTVADVSRRSGIASSTIYRHFPTRDEMVAAAAMGRLRQFINRDATSWGIEDMRAHLVALWTDLASNLPLARQGAISEVGREMRRVRFKSVRQMTEDALRAIGKDPGNPDVRRFVACMEALQSTHAFLDFHERQGLTPEEAADAVVWAVKAMGAAAGVDATTFRISLPGAAAASAEPTGESPK